MRLCYARETAEGGTIDGPRSKLCCTTPSAAGADYCQYHIAATKGIWACAVRACVGFREEHPLLCEAHLAEWSAWGKGLLSHWLATRPNPKAEEVDKCQS